MVAIDYPNNIITLYPDYLMYIGDNVRSHTPLVLCTTQVSTIQPPTLRGAPLYQCTCFELRVTLHWPQLLNWSAKYKQGSLKDYFFGGSVKDFDFYTFSGIIFFTKLLIWSHNFQTLKESYHYKISQTLAHIVLYQDAKFCVAQSLRTGFSLAEDPETSCCEVLQNIRY